MTTRTDIHRAGALVPEDYEYVLSYARPKTDGGWPIPGFNINCELERTFDKQGQLTFQRKHRDDGQCCIIGLRHIAKVAWAEHGSTCKCTACGAFFCEGDVWRHKATGEHVNLGHTCVEKYQFLAEHAHFDATVEQLRAMGVRMRQARKAEEDREAFLNNHPGLREAFETCHHNIVADIRWRFLEYGSISEKQIALVLKIADDAKKPRPEEAHVPAPVGDKRVMVRGRVVSVKSMESDYGITFKMTVKVETPEGSWLAWGSVPASIEVDGLKGKTVEFSAALKAGRDPHFAIFSRPTKASVIATSDGGAVPALAEAPF